MQRCNQPPSKPFVKWSCCRNACRLYICEYVFEFMDRPDIFAITCADELIRWYWTKQELIGLCKHKLLDRTGAKETLLLRLVDAFNGKTSSVSKSSNSNPKPLSKKNVAVNYTLETIITPAYKNGREARSFFQQHCGPTFRFSIALLAFIKKNQGKTLHTVIEEWHRLEALTKTPGYKSTLPPQLQYNQYIRDFFSANPGKTLKEAQYCWKLKRSLPTGKHFYEDTDLQL